MGNAASQLGQPLRARPGAAALEEAARAVTAEMPVGVFLASAGGEYDYVNPRWCALAGLGPERAAGQGWKTALHPEDAARAAAGWAAAVASGERSLCSYRFRRRDGSDVRVESHATPLYDEEGEVTAWVGTCLEAAGSGAAAQPAGGMEELLRSAFHDAPIGLGLVRPDGAWLGVNPAFCRLLGYDEQELLTLDLAQLTVSGDALAGLEEEGEARTETRYLRADGSTLWVAASMRLVRDRAGKPLHYIVQIEDIGERKQTEHELRQLADHDALTGLLNRRGFMEGLRRELRRMERSGEYGALLLLDLDNFKQVNDTAGHLAGDQVLRTTADVLRRRLRATDVIGRLGGDEFAALVLNVTPRQANEIAGETTDALRSLTVLAGDVTLEVAASIGVIAIDELRDEDEEELLAAADRAMYRAKSLRRDD